jgi:uncharacterized protein (TIGR04551 family)
VTRFPALCLFTLSAAALAQTPERAKPAEPGKEASSPDTRGQGAEAIGNRVEREQLKREVMDEIKRAMDKQRDEVRDEVRAQVATQSANRSLEEDFQIHEQKKRLELFEVDGYFRVRPELFHNFDLRRGTDANGAQIFPRPLRDPSGKTLADANMRWRLEPTLNVSEDIRLHAQFDLFDNLILGSTPEVGDKRVLFAVDSPTQVTPTALKNALLNSVQLKRVYGEVNTPIGQLFFGRMGSHWGLGMLANSGNCVDCDYGDTVDRFMFVAKVGDFFVVPMLDFISEGPTSATSSELLGPTFDRDQGDDARAYSIAIARRDTDAEITRKLQAGQRIFNYGLYFIYRHQSWDTAPNQGNAVLDPTTTLGFVPRGANLYIPNLWFKFQTPKLRIEAEVAGIFGKIGNSATTLDGALGQSLTVTQVGAVAQADYKALDALSLNLEFGFASGDKAAGLGNSPGNSASPAAGTQPGQIDGPQFCLDATCRTLDNRITNFRFNRDYRVDLILWREIFNGVTDAIYIKPGAKYDLTEGFSVWANLIYSRAVFGESTPSSHLDGSGNLVGDANLGVEIDGGIRYDSGDGFQAAVAYGVLFPLAGLRNNLPNPAVDAQTAQTVRAWFVIRY